MTARCGRSLRNLTLLLCCAADAALAQTSQSPTIRAASPEVFHAVKQFYEYNRTSALQVQSLGKQDFPAYTREKFVFTGVQHSRVPAYLAIPKTGAAPLPVVILMGGIAGSKEDRFAEGAKIHTSRASDLCCGHHQHPHPHVDGA